MKYIISFQIKEHNKEPDPDTYYFAGLDEEACLEYTTNIKLAKKLELLDAEDWRFRLLSRYTIPTCNIEPLLI